MTAWREQELERIIGGTLDEATMTEESVRALVRTFGHETGVIDFKSKRDFAAKYDDKTWSHRQERAKDITMFANARGGVIVFGVEDEKREPEVEKRPQPFDSGYPHELIETFRKDVSDFARPIPQYDMFPVPAANPAEFYLIAVIPPSSLAPHAVIMKKGDNRRALDYFVRTDGSSHSRELEEYEVADRYRARFRSAEDRRQAVEQIWSAGIDAISRNGDIWLAVSVSPDVPVEGGLTVAARAEITEWADSHSFPAGAVGVVTANPDYPFPGPGYVEYTQSLKVGAIETVTMLETDRMLYADGSGFAAIRIGYHPENLAPTVIEQDQLVDALTACVPYLLKWSADRSGQWGNATLTAAIVDGATPDDSFEPAIRIDRPARGRAVTRSYQSVASVPLATTLTMQDRLAVTYSVSAALLQMFGCAEPELLTATGEIRNGYGYLNTHERHVAEWAKSHSVPRSNTTPS